MIVQLLELSWWLYIHGQKQLHEVIDTSSETLNCHILRPWDSCPPGLSPLKSKVAWTGVLDKGKL